MSLFGYSYIRSGVSEHTIIVLKTQSVNLKLAVVKDEVRTSHYLYSGMVYRATWETRVIDSEMPAALYIIILYGWSGFDFPVQPSRTIPPGNHRHKRPYYASTY